MGCPAPKIANNGSGSALMKSPLLCRSIVSAVVRAVPCAACGKGRVSSRIVFLSDWGSTGNPRPCDCFPEGEDMLESRQGISNYRCPACGESYNTYFVEYRWACHGFK